MKCVVKIKPLSVNEAWKGPQTTSQAYSNYKRAMGFLLAKSNEKFEGRLKLQLTFGFSSRNSDIDNPLKPLIDIMQKKYKFNDNQIFDLHVKKKIVPRGQEYLKIKLTKMK